MRPDRRTAVLPRVAFPCLVADLARPRHGPEPPDFAARLRVVRAELAPHALLASADAHVDETVVVGCRRVDHASRRELRPPHHGARELIERDERVARGRGKDLALGDRDAPVEIRAALQPTGRIPPLERAGPRVPGPDMARGQVHRAVDHDGRALHPASDRTFGMHHPGRAETTDVGPVDLRQRRVALIEEAAADVREVGAVVRHELRCLPGGARRHAESREDSGPLENGPRAHRHLPGVDMIALHLDRAGSSAASKNRAASSTACSWTRSRSTPAASRHSCGCASRPAGVHVARNV